jgi:cytochrome c oxidase subunit 2
VVEFDSYIVPSSDLEIGTLRLMETDQSILFPRGSHVRFVLGRSDVIHDWAVPRLGLKLDCVPGRLNQTSTLSERAGVFMGQCSELCGVYHGFMPISSEAVRVKNYLSWLLAIGFQLRIILPRPPHINIRFVSKTYYKKILLLSLRIRI